MVGPDCHFDIQAVRDGGADGHKEAAGAPSQVYWLQKRPRTNRTQARRHRAGTRGAPTCPRESGKITYGT